MQTTNKQKMAGWAGFMLLEFFYIAAVLIAPVLARSNGMLVFGQAGIPMASFARVLTSFSNICIICLVVFYRKPGFIRLDGETWDGDDRVPCRIAIVREDDFGGWDAWKKGHKEGFDCSVRLVRKGNSIIFSTRNFGLSVEGTAELPDRIMQGTTPVYVALTGDQCALTGIRALPA